MSNEFEVAEKQFATLSSGRLFVKFAIPGLFSMIFSSLSMIIDGIFIGKFIGSVALAAVNIVMPIMMITFALADMVAVGASVKTSIALGEQNKKKANSCFSASILIILGLGAFSSFIGFIFVEPVVFAVITDANLAILALEYIKPFLFTLPFLMPLFAMDNFLRICGKAKFSMWMNISVAVLNIFLDWLLIGKLGLGIDAAAWATGGSMVFGVLIAFIPFVSNKLTLRFGKPVLSIKDFIGIVYNGASEFFANIAGSLLLIVVNTVLLHFGGATAIAAFSIVMYIHGVLSSGIYGMLDSIQPAVSYNIGAKNKKKIMELFKIACCVAGAASILCMTIMLLFPEALAKLFTQIDDVGVIDLTVSAVFLFAPSYLFMWFNVTVSSFLTSFDRPKESLTIMLFGSVILPLLSIFILISIVGVYGVFVTPTITGFLTMLISLPIWIKTLKKVNKQMQNGSSEIKSNLPAI